MKICPNCKMEISDTAKFCRNCGFNIKNYEENKEIFCEECGAKIPSGSAFCEECGFKLENNTESATPNANGTFDFSALGGLSTVATEQLYEQNGLKVENGILVEYVGKRRNVTIPGTVEEIFDKVFENNEFVTDVTIEEGVQVIGKRAFASCPSLVEINIPSSCKKLYEDTFENDNLERITFAERNNEVIFSMISEDIKNYLSKDEINEFIKEENGKVLVNLKGMADFASEKQKAEEEEEIKKIYKIEDGVLVKCKTNIAKAKIPNTVIKIGDEAFKECRNLIAVEIPNSVTSIGNYAFDGCTNLTSIEIPNSVTTIRYRAFCDCTSLTSIKIPNSVTSIGGSAFARCTNLTSIEIPNSVTSIGLSAFYNCTSLTNIKIPNSVTTIGEYAFEGCTNLTSIEIPNSVTTIGIYTFDGCTNLTSIEIPNSVTAIGNYAFANCTNLKTIKVSRKCNRGTEWKRNCPAEIIYID